jgi:hypothetical protein
VNSQTATAHLDVRANLIHHQQTVIARPLKFIASDVDNFKSSAL